MKEVTIKSKIVGRGGASAATSPGKGVSVDMSGCLLKQIWEKVFEFRLTDDGTEYLFAKMDLAVQGGVTMYANGGNLNLKGIYDGLPIDNDTIYWDGTVLRSRGVGEGGVTHTLLGDLKNVGAWANAIATEDRIMVQKKDSSYWEALELSKIGGSASFENVKESGAGNAYTSFVLSEDKKSLTFLKAKVFAEKSNSLSGYGIADAYTKTNVDSLLSDKWTKDDAKIANWDSAYSWGNHAQAGYFKSADFTKNKIKTTLGISDWALASTKPSYTTKEVAEDTNLYFTNARAVSALTETLKGYVTLSGTQTISGEKNFTGGLKVNGSPIVYNATGKYWKLEGDLIVTGGVTMFGNDSSFNPSTITQAVNIDGNTLVRKNGVIMLNPDIQIGGGTDIDLSEYAKKATTLSGYGITDAYTKTEVGSNFVAKTTKDFMKVNGSLISNVDFNNYYTSGSYNNTTGNGSGNTNAPGSFGLMLVFGDKSGYAAQLHVNSGNTSVKIRTRYVNVSSFSWNTWKELAYTTSNVASSTKLETPRKIWGQDFDGTEDVSGAITGATTGSFSGNVSMGSATINGGNLTYDSTKKYWKLEGDLLVTGGVTMFGNDSSFSPSTITQAVNVDGTTIINDGKKLMLNPDIQLGGGGVTDYNDLDNLPDLSVYALKTSLSSYQTKITTTNKLDYGLISGTPTIPTNTNQLTNGAGFITSSGSITGNAATATALKNARTIWGNSFDGSANVSGNIALSARKIFWHGDASNYYISCPADTGGAGLMYKAYSSHRFVAGGAERFTILSSGYVGVNNNNPTTAFHVKGTSTFDGDVLARDIKPQSTEAYSIGRYDMLWKGLFLSTDASVPRTEKGVTFCSSNGYAEGKIGANSSGIGIYTVGGLYLRGGCTKGANGTMTESSTGAVIDASGNMLVTGGVTMYSDLRKKTILNHVELSLKEVADAPLIEHYYNSDESKRTHVGSVAQYWAGLNDWFCKEDEEGFLTMEIQNAALASAISVARELTRYESKTDKQIKKLQKRIGELEEEIENLKKM